MRLHQMIEFVAQAEDIDDIRTKEDKEWNPGKRLTETLREWCDCKTFEFGRIESINRETGKSMLAYSNELGRHRLFRLPFQKMIISFEVSSVAGVTILAEEKDDDFIVFSIFTALKNTAFTSHCWASARSDDDGLFLKPYGCVVSRIVRDEKRTDIAKETQKNIPTWTIGLLTMLNAKGVEQRITPAPHKLNKHRTAAGKPAIGEVREILINVDGKRYLPSGDAEKGSHASPRLHWRRGHIRRLPSGEITHVRPHLVGATLGGEEPAKKDYRVKPSAT